MLSGQSKLNRRGFLKSGSQLAAVVAIDPLVCRAALSKKLPWDKDGSGGTAVAPRSIYSIHQLSEQELLDTYEHLLREACSNAAMEWKTVDFDANAGLWGDGASSGNGGIRTIVSMLLACATLIRYGHLDRATSSDLVAKSRAALRFTAASHRTGRAMCTDGKKWGATPEFGSESWQSGMWTGTLAWASWLIWNELDSELQQELERVIAWECDILSHRPPPNGLWLDTKAEENGWEVPCLVMSTLMFPSHPHAADWQQAAYRYMMNVLCTEADTRDTSISDGRPVNEWIKGANLQPDYTLENHGIFHPAYVGCSSYFLTQAVMYYTYAHRAVPQAATHHLLDTWRMFQTVILPWGESACPQGMDWELHGLPYINLYASLATRWRDPLAAHLEQCSLQYLRAWQEMCHGSLATPGSRFGLVRHAINAEQASYGLLAHKIFGPAVDAISSRAAAFQEKGVRAYPYVDFVAHRTLDKFASFSWKNRVMGLLIPLGPGHEGNPDFTAPIQDGFVGSFEIDSLPENKRKDKPMVLEHERLETPDGFETTGTVLSHSGRLKQTIKITSLGDRFVVYEDQVIAVEPVTITGERGLAFGIENDEITGGMRVLTCQQSQITFDWQRPQGPVPIPGSWVNVDGRLGAAVLAGSGISYVQGAGYSGGISICTDILYGSFSNRSRDFNAGEAVAHRLAVFAVNVTPDETAAFAKSCSIREVGREEGKKRILRFRALDGNWSEVRLLPFSPADHPAL